MHFHKWSEEVGAVQENPGDKGGSETLAEVWGKVFARRREAFHRVEGTLR